MGTGWTWRRSLLVVALAATAGCRWTPIRQPDPIAAREKARPFDRGTAAPIAQLPPLPDLVPINDQEAFRTAEAPTTPLLDAAAARAAAIEEVRANPPADSVVTPEPSSPTTAEPPAPESPPASAPIFDPHVTPAQFEVQAVPPAPAETPETEVVAKTPVDPWVASLAQLRQLARERQRDGGPRAETWSTRERVLECLAHDEDDASMWAPIAAALASPQPEVEPAPEPAPAPQATPAPETMLAILDLKLCRKVQGFGRTKDLPAHGCKPGQQVLLYCELDGLRDEALEEEFLYRLSARVELIRTSDNVRVWEGDLGEQEDRCRRRRRDFFANYRIQIPTDMPDGEYQIHLVVSDLIGRNDAERTLAITVAH